MFLKNLILGLLSTTVFEVSAQCVSGNCQLGTGTFVYESGARYIGQFKAGRPDGNGKLTYSNKNIYSGAFVAGRREGQGEMLLTDGQRYNGQFKAGEMKGKGKTVFPNGDTHEGLYATDLPNGKGTYTFKDGDVYKGDFVAGKFEGQGIIIFTDGAKYEGQWSQNEKEGLGTFYFTNGTTQTGNWANGEFLGTATNGSASSSSQVTSTKPQNASGNIPTTVATGGKTLRDCNAGQCQTGTGFYTYADGSRWEGDFLKGQPHGKGKLFYADKSRYEGQFEHHAPNGEGIMYYPTGRVYGAVWLAGTPVRELNTNKPLPSSSPVSQELNPQVKVWAVVVGVGRYITMPSLKYTDDDAFHLYAFLKSPEGGALPEGQIKLLIDDDATRDGIILGMQEVFGKADANDVVLFYFSGHGLPGSFLPVDYDGFNNRLLHTDIKNVLDKSKAKHKICIADACHSGSLLAARDAAEQAATVQRLYDAFAASTGGTALLMSSKSEEFSLEDQGLRSGVFSHYLIRGLRGEADTNKNKVVDITELYNFTSKGVRQYTTGIQTPVISGVFDAKMPVSSIR